MLPTSQVNVLGYGNRRFKSNKLADLCPHRCDVLSFSNEFEVVDVNREKQLFRLMKEKALPSRHLFEATLQKVVCAEGFPIQPRLGVSVKV